MAEQNTIRVIDIIFDTFVDGPGMRTTVYCAGCRHFCEGCHNPQTWKFDQGTAMTPEEIMAAILEGSPSSNITFSGGDPLYQVEGFAALAKLAKENYDKNIWCYTGFLYEEIVADARLRQILPYIDVLVDGLFVLAERDTSLSFRGSRNQRLIDVPATLKNPDGVIVPWTSWW
ncbi:MAG: anaerobic ribonucleoside-triphosphate reductase activating protein [Opitutales bacterium]|nr:anaerobic ribonucleoside-triphosphate reductase activating protein [Opitutales bacterium]